MPFKISDYEPIVGKSVIDELRTLSDKLAGKLVQFINSTAVGGGVAEILSRAVPLLNDLGVKVQWDVIRGGESYFQVTKKFHNALHGRKESIRKEDFNIFLETSQANIEQMNLYGDIMFIHDPQPIALIKRKSTMNSKWLWRCHIDVSNPNKKVWHFLKRYINDYDAAVFSAPGFSRALKIRQFLIPPSIDPLSVKNKGLPEGIVQSVLRKYRIKKSKPIICQISRFDYLKDPFGVIDAYRMVKKYNDCQLVLAGNIAGDDPESVKVLTEVRETVGNDPDIHILVIPPAENDIDINALQRASDVILQKSLREGFALTVTEALWKAKPVVASAVGGIPLQIKHKYSGLLCHSVEGAAFNIKQLLNAPDYAKKLGINAREHIKQNFLLTRHLRDYLLLFLSLYHHRDIIRL